MDIRDAEKYISNITKYLGAVRNEISGLLNGGDSRLREYLTRIGDGFGIDYPFKVPYLATAPAAVNLTNSTAFPGHHGDEILILFALLPFIAYGLSQGLELFAEVTKNIIEEIESFFIDINEDVETLYLTGEIIPTMRRDGTTGYKWTNDWRNWIPGSWCRPWEKEEKRKK